MSPPSVTTDANVETRLALVEKEFGIVHGMFRKFETAVEKMAETTNTMQKLLAVHDQRLQEREKAESALNDGIERRREDAVRRDKEVAEKIDKLSSEMRASIREELGNFQSQFKNALDNLEEGQDELTKKIDKNTEQADTKFKELETRVRDLERWRWIIAGIAGFVGFLASNSQLVANLLGAAGAG